MGGAGTSTTLLYRADGQILLFRLSVNRSTNIIPGPSPNRIIASPALEMEQEGPTLADHRQILLDDAIKRVLDAASIHVQATEIMVSNATGLADDSFAKNQASPPVKFLSKLLLHNAD